jgi:hypothetical protein
MFDPSMLFDDGGTHGGFHGPDNGGIHGGTQGGHGASVHSDPQHPGNHSDNNAGHGNNPHPGTKVPGTHAAVAAKKVAHDDQPAQPVVKKDGQGTEQHAAVAAKKVIAGQHDNQQAIDKDGYDPSTSHDDPIQHCPYQPGTSEAKAWWTKVEADCKAAGMYQGKPLVPGEAGKGQGDFGFMVDKMRIANGYDAGLATKIAANIKYKLYGGGGAKEALMAAMGRKGASCG